MPGNCPVVTPAVLTYTYVVDRMRVMTRINLPVMRCASLIRLSGSDKDDPTLKPYSHGKHENI